MTSSEIRVNVVGAVARGGWYLLAGRPTIRDALTAAGGLRGQGSAKPALVVSLNRPFGWDDQPERTRYRWNMKTYEGGDWAQFELRDGDGLVFGFQVNDDES